MSKQFLIPSEKLLPFINWLSGQPNQPTEETLFDFWLDFLEWEQESNK